MQKRVKEQRETYIGLCKTCEKAEICTYQRHPRQVVLNCLEFEDISETSTPPAASRARLGIVLEEQRDQHEPGLCAQCEQRVHCTFPHIEGGVWFCEEFH